MRIHITGVGFKQVLLFSFQSLAWVMCAETTSQNMVGYQAFPCTVVMVPVRNQQASLVTFPTYQQMDFEENICLDCNNVGFVRVLMLLPNMQEEIMTNETAFAVIHVKRGFVMYCI